MTKKRQMDRNCGEAAPPKEALANVLCLLIRGQGVGGEAVWDKVKEGRKTALQPLAPTCISRTKCPEDSE